jgi:hypothetical protein
MALMEKRWPEIRSALMIAADVLASFGFSERTLSAGSVLIPIAYYVFIRGLDSRYVSSGADAAERQAMRFWVTRSLMKRGVWGSGLDTLLARQRDVIREHGTTRFPVDELEAAMASLGKSLKFDDAEVEELSELRYGRPRTFATLAMLYPGLDLTKVFHEDHIFPRSLFTRPKLKKTGIPPTRISEYVDRVDGLPNLQLLAGVPNTEKQAKLPGEWLAGPQFPNEATRAQYMQENDLSGLPLDLEHFLDFHEGRRERIERRLRVLLGVGARMEPAKEPEAAGDAGAEDEGLDEDVEPPDEPPDVGSSWSHEQIRDWVRTDFVRSLVDGFEQWLVEVGGPTGEMRHRKRTQHTFYVGRQVIVYYYFAHKWMHFWLPRKTESDVVALSRLSDADAVHVNPERPGISGKIVVETDLSILEDRIRERVQLILREGA